jgi:hypothetical protein
MVTLAIRYDFSTVLVNDARRRRRVAKILTSPCFRELERVSAHRGDRWTEHTPTTVAAIAEILGDARNRGVSLDTGRGRELVASGEISNGTSETNQGATRFDGDLVFPLVPADLDETIAAVCELADALDAGAGFVTAELDHASAQLATLGGPPPRPRPGMSARRALERRSRDWRPWQRHCEIAGPEWGTFLGAEHLARLDLAQVRRSGAFARVLEISRSSLAFLQLTADPADDLRDDFEPRLQRAREVLAPILMDLREVSAA